MGCTYCLIDQSLMEIFQRVQEIWSGQESVTDGQTDEGHSYDPLSTSWRGINKLDGGSTKDYLYQIIFESGL